MQTVELTINVVVKAFGGIDVASGSKFKATIEGVRFGTPNTIAYQGSGYINQTEMDNENPFVYEAIKAPIGLNPVITGGVNSDLFTYETDSEGCLTASSLDSFKGEVKKQLADLLSINESDIV